MITLPHSLLCKSCRAALFLLLLSSNIAHAVPLVGDVLDDMEKHLSSAESTLGNNINIQEANTYSLLYNSVEQLRAQFKDDLGKQLDKIEMQRQVTINDLKNSIDAINGDVNNQRAELQVAAINLVTQVKFWKSTVPFIVAGIDNQVLYKQNVDYQVTVFGNGFGIDQGNVKYSLSAAVDGKPLSSDSIDRLADGVKIIIPSGTINSRFAQNTPVRIPVEFSSRVTHPCQIPLFSCSDNYSTNFNLTLVPTVAATGSIQSEKEGFQPGKVSTIAGPTIPETPELHGQKSLTLWKTPVYAVPGGYELVSASFTQQCEGGGDDHGGCQFSYNRKCDYAVDMSSVQCEEGVTSHAHQDHWQIVLAEKIPVPDPYKVVSYTFPTNEAVVVRYNAQADKARLIGQTSTGQLFDISLLPFVQSAYDPVQCSGSFPVKDNDGTVYNVHRCVATIK